MNGGLAAFEQGEGVRQPVGEFDGQFQAIGRRPRREAQRAGDVLTNPLAIEFGPRAGPALGHHSQEPKLLGLRPGDVPFPRDQGVDPSGRGTDCCGSRAARPPQMTGARGRRNRT